MFGVDDFAVWFAWYFVSDVANHPATHRAVERAHAAIVSEAPPPQADEPQAILDWLTHPENGGADPAAVEQDFAPRR